MNRWLRRLAVPVIVAATLIGTAQVGIADPAPVAEGSFRVVVASASADRAAPTKAPCFPPGAGECTSDDPNVTVYVLNEGDTTGCVSNVTVDWGDKTGPQTFVVPGGPAGYEVIGTHKYSKIGIYQIPVNGVVVSGNCGFFSGSLAFTYGCSNPVGPPDDPDYCIPADWNSHPAATSLTPGVEPLNVIISARSNVPLGDVMGSLGDWSSVPGVCLSTETADVNGTGPAPQDSNWRLGGCIGGNLLSYTGDENHVRIWSQPIPGSDKIAYFIAASFETACLFPPGGAPAIRLKEASFPYRGSVWHCINGGPGSYHSNGYDKGAKDFVTDLRHAADDQGWNFGRRIDGRPAGRGANNVAFNGQAYVLTLTH